MGTSANFPLGGMRVRPVLTRAGPPGDTGPTSADTVRRLTSLSKPAEEDALLMELTSDSPTSSQE
jgi:hypothetical protein